MVVVLLLIVVVGLGVALLEVASSRRATRRDTRSQLDALSRVVEPQRRDRHRRVDRQIEPIDEQFDESVDRRFEQWPEDTSDAPSPPDDD